MTSYNPIDPNIFEPDKEEYKEPTKGEIIWRYIRFVVAFIVIAGLLYISGVYQSLLYRKTPASVSQQKVESMIDAELIELPLYIYVFVNTESGS